MAEAYIVDAVRTPRALGKPGKGAYYKMHPQYLAATVLKALKERNGLNTSDIDDVIWGTSAQKGWQGGDMGRMAALDAGFDVRVSGVTLDRFSFYVFICYIYHFRVLYLFFLSRLFFSCTKK